MNECDTNYTICNVDINNRYKYLSFKMNLKIYSYF